MSSSDKSRALKVWSESVAKNMEMFQEGAEMMVRDHQKSNVKHSSFAIHLQHMSARESSVPIKASLETLSQRIDHTESERLKVLAQMQALMVNKFTKYPGELKVLNTSISKRNTQVSEFARAERDFASARASGDSRKIDIASGHLKVAEEHMRSAEDVLNKRLGDFELMRVSEMKELLKRYIRNEIFFHAKSIEGLTQAYQEVVKIEPETEKTIFLRRIRETEYQDKRTPGTNALTGQPIQSPTQQQQLLLQAQPSQYQLQHQSSQHNIPTQSPQFSPQNSQTGVPLQSPQAR